jgi:hypothetical protein
MLCHNPHKMINNLGLEAHLIGKVKLATKQSHESNTCYVYLKNSDFMAGKVEPAVDQEESHDDDDNSVIDATMDLGFSPVLKNAAVHELVKQAQLPHCLSRILQEIETTEASLNSVTRRGNKGTAISAKAITPDKDSPVIDLSNSPVGYELISKSLVGSELNMTNDFSKWDWKLFFSQPVTDKDPANVKCVNWRQQNCWMISDMRFIQILFSWAPDHVKELLNDLIPFEAEWVAKLKYGFISHEECLEICTCRYIDQIMAKTKKSIKRGVSADAFDLFCFLFEDMSKKDLKNVISLKFQLEYTCQICKQKNQSKVQSRFFLSVQRESLMDENPSIQKCASHASSISNRVTKNQNKCCNKIKNSQINVIATPEFLFIKMPQVEEGTMQPDKIIERDLTFKDKKYILVAGVIHIGDSQTGGHFICQDFSKTGELRTYDGLVNKEAKINKLYPKDMRFGFLYEDQIHNTSFVVFRRVEENPNNAVSIHFGQLYRYLFLLVIVYFIF